MKADYWDIDSFLAEEAPVTVVTNQPLRHMARVSRQQCSLPADSKLEMPLWFGLLLARRLVGEIELPQYLDKPYLAAIQANPTILNLRDQTNYFFEVGATLAEWMSDTGELALTLLRAFVLRVKYIFEYLERSNNPNLARKLTESELKVFRQCKLAGKEYKDWKERKLERLCIAEVIRHTHKRRQGCRL